MSFFSSPFKAVAIKMKESAITSCDNGNLFGVNIVNVISFDDYMTNLCHKTSQKIHALSRVASLMSFDKKGLF